MKALPLTYNRIQFRSRLEADFAATLDSLNVPWQYEPEGFEMSDGTCYSPDFWLPTSKAWLEVKGDHNLGVDKVHRFAADLWAASGAADTYDRDAPLVLLGRGPKHDGIEHYNELRPWPTVLGVMGFDKRYSVTLVQCPNCRQRTYIALWQPWCRSCGKDAAPDEDGVLDAWMDSSMDIRFNNGFIRVPRPAGKG